MSPAVSPQADSYICGLMRLLGPADSPSMKPVKLAAIAVLCLGVGQGTSVALAKGNVERPSAMTFPASNVTASSATLYGGVDPHEEPAGYHFEYGTTTGYGSRIPATDVTVNEAAIVAQPLSGLHPGSAYHFRIVATNCGGCAEGTTFGADFTFTTSGGAPKSPQGAPGEVSPTSPPSTHPGEAPPTPPGTPPVGSGPALFPGQPSSPLSPAGEPLPVLGHTAIVNTASGIVTVQTAKGFQPISGPAAVPLGALIDASGGVARLTTALTANARQSVTVWGGSFRIAQKHTGDGMTTLIPVGTRLGCARRGHASAARGRRPVKPVKLWAEDRHGRYSTRGQNSVATVRGTRWETIETCAGTLTRVLRGLISVRDLHTHHRVLVTAGHSYLARS